MNRFVGYGNEYPPVVWPGNARVALNFVINYEEGAEQNILDGDSQSESYLTDWPGLSPLIGKRQLSSESLFEYGSRVGIWRLIELFESHSIPLTLFVAAQALERNPSLAEKLKSSSHEVAGHGYRWINYAQSDEAQEKEHIEKALSVLEKLTGKKVLGWYTGRCSSHTRKLIAACGLIYDSDSYADDLPYWSITNGKPHLIIPYSLDTNDARFAVSPGFSDGESFFIYLKDAFDCLYREGKITPKMMSVGLHGRFSGRPGRAEAVRRFIEYAGQFDRVWICQRHEIAKHWIKHYGF